MSFKSDFGRFFGLSGAVSCLTLSCNLLVFYLFFGLLSVIIGLGAAYGTAQAGLGLCRAGTRKPSIAIKGIIPVAMAGVRAIYGLVLAIIILSGVRESSYTCYRGLGHLSAGMCCGVAQLVSGVTVGVVGESSTQAVSLRSSLFASSVLILIFSEALALYGLICGMIMAQLS